GPYLPATGPGASARSQCTESRTDWLHTAQKRLRASLFLCTARTCSPHLRCFPAHLSQKAPLSSPRYEPPRFQEEAFFSGCASPRRTSHHNTSHTSRRIKTQMSFCFVLNGEANQVTLHPLGPDAAATPGHNGRQNQGCASR